MKPRVFLDTNVFIYAFEFPHSNSRKIIDLLNRGAFEAIISESVVREVQRYFGKHYGKQLAGAFRYYLLLSCAVIPFAQIEQAMDGYRGKIKDNDLEQLTVAKELGLRFLVSLDRDFLPFEEYLTPREFLSLLGKAIPHVEY